MKTANTRNKATSILACTMGFIFVLTGCSSSDDAVQVIPDEFVLVSGTITNITDTAEPGVAVEGVYTNPGDALNPMTTTDSSGNFSLQVLKNNAVFLRATKDTFATINSEKAPLIVNVTGLDIGMPTEVEAQAVIDTAFDSTLPVLMNHAWLVVDVEDTNGDEVNGETISSSITPTDFVYTNCDGTDSASSVTTGAPCLTDRDGPMYIAYFDAAGEANIIVGSETKVAPIRMGEITALEFEVGNDLPVAVNDAFNVVQGDTTNLNLAANDSDADDGLDLASITIVASPANGTVVVKTDGTVDYTHDPSATITDTFSYAISDNSGAISNTATVTLTVFGNVAAGQVKYDAACAECHAAGSHDTTFQGSASDLYDDGEKLVTNLSSIGGMGSIPDIDITVQELIDLKAFLEDPTTAP